MGVESASQAIVFLDSLQFMGASLDALITNLDQMEDTHFKNLKRHFPHDVFHMLLRKGVYLHSYINS